MSLDCGEKPEYSERTQADMENMLTLHRVVRQCGNHHTAMSTFQLFHFHKALGVFDLEEFYTLTEMELATFCLPSKCVDHYIMERPR